MCHWIFFSSKSDYPSQRHFTSFNQNMRTESISVRMQCLDNIQQSLIEKSHLKSLITIWSKRFVITSIEYVRTLTFLALAFIYESCKAVYVANGRAEDLHKSLIIWIHVCIGFFLSSVNLTPFRINGEFNWIILALLSNSLKLFKVVVFAVVFIDFVATHTDPTDVFIWFSFLSQKIDLQKLHKEKDLSSEMCFFSAEFSLHTLRARWGATNAMSSKYLSDLSYNHTFISLPFIIKLRVSTYIWIPPNSWKIFCSVINFFGHLFLCKLVFSCCARVFLFIGGLEVNFTIGSLRESHPSH